MTGDVLWSEATRMPECLMSTATAVQGRLTDIATLIEHARRVTFTGNGASMFAAIGGWLESAGAASSGGPTARWCPPSLLLDGSVQTSPDDLVVAVSTSGELRDLVELAARKPRVRTLALTAYPSSPIGRAADLVLPLTVLSQEAVTHTQAYASAVAAALAVGALLRGADVQAQAVADGCAAALGEARALLDTPLTVPRSVVCAGTGRAWPAAMQAALMVRELSGIPAEGVEAREAITSSLAAMAPDTLVVVLGTVDDPVATEVTAAARNRGCETIELLVPATGSALQLAAFPGPLALAIALARRTGWNADSPTWYADYLTVARVAAP